MTEKGVEGDNKEINGREKNPNRYKISTSEYPSYQWVMGCTAVEAAMHDAIEMLKKIHDYEHWH